ncbi:UNVERIFIED_CONTAM: hypothetical protein K2H54_015644 [Gekko kuhli]
MCLLAEMLLSYCGKYPRGSFYYKILACKAIGLDERPASGSWGTGDQNSSTFDQVRQGYGEGSHYGEHRDLPSHNSISSSPFLGSGIVGMPGYFGREGTCPWQGKASAGITMTSASDIGNAGVSGV